MKTILLKLSGPLQSWGTDSHFETRQTDLHPSKSAIIGLIAASFGYKRDDDESIKKLNELDFGTRIDQQGRLLRDYHIARKYKSNGDFDRTYVTNRYYLEDAIFLVAISHNDDDFMDEILENLKSPYFQPYMGRRSCPLTYDFIMGSTDQDIIDSLTDTPWQAKEWYKRNHDNSLDCYVDSHLITDSISYPRRDNVISFSQKDRKHRYRNESRISVRVPDLGFDTSEEKQDHNFWDKLPEE